jgi:hypothetical protein
MPPRKTELYDQLWQVAASPGQWVPILVVLGALIAVIVWLRVRFRDDDDPAEDSLELLSQFRELHQRGELSEDEFRSIKSRLSASSHRLLTGGNCRSDSGSGMKSSGSDSDAASAVTAEDSAGMLPTDSIQGRGEDPGAEAPIES